MSSVTHENATSPRPSGDVSPVASEKPPTMAWNLSTDASSDAPARPPLASQQSSSLPSTPYQHPRRMSIRSRSPSPRRGNTSPRSTQSESNHALPSLRKPFGGCKYETGMAFFRRRMPYSLGGDLLPEEKEGLKEKLTPEEEEKLSGDMREMYDRLLPSAESDNRRKQLVKKLEKLLNNQWPGSNIKVHVFGSSGNKLCSSDSDVDICITTTYKELERVCLLADVLAKHGMERVVCVSHAKVPIVKIWDPELQLACDMNVNNTLALENTRMIRTYVEIDERVRPLAMIIKYWTKRRVLNDAALGGTLSSYTWICLIINFLQTRDPPILPSLQKRPHKKRVEENGLVSSFDDDLDSLVGFGRANKQSLGELLFQFFRYYGHEVDYEKYVISVREGKLIPKESKGWHLLQNNRLCVEEPFNTSRNLGNTADDTSFRGVHIELRRAFKAVARANLEEACEQYEFPPEEERTWERPPPQPRPVLTTPSYPSRGGRGGARGGRHSSQYTRGGNSGRRSSSAANKPNNFRLGNAGLTPSELSLQAQQAQYLLHDHLYQQIQILQAQEQELRMQLQNQALLSGRPPPVLIRQPFIQFPFPQQQEATGDENSRARSGTVNHPPLTAPIRQQVFYSPAYLPLTVSNVPGSNTNPPSPSATAAVPEGRRNHRRSSISNGSPGGSLRAHSQPARPLQTSMVQNFPPLYSSAPAVDSQQDSKQRLTPGSPGGTQGGGETTFMPSSLPNISRSAYLDESRPPEYIGYYLGGSPQLQAYHQNPMMSPFVTPVGLAFPSGGVSPFLRSAHDYRPAGSPPTKTPSSSPDHASASNSKSASSQQQTSARPIPSHDRGPLIVDGSVPPSEHRSPVHGDSADHFASMNLSTSNSDEPSYDTPASASDTLSQDPQDHSSFEMDRQSFLSRQNPEIPNQVNANETYVNGHGGRLAFLSGRLQNFHISNPDRSAESSPQSTWERAKTNHYSSSQEVSDQDTPESRLSASGDRTTTASGLSPVTEPRTSSPTAKRRSNGPDFEKVNGVNHKTKPKGRQDAPGASSPAPVDTKERQPESLPRKPNGVSPGHESGTATTNGGWQTTKKKHKRGAKSSAEPRHNHSNGVEPLPVDESMRKGG